MILRYTALQEKNTELFSIQWTFLILKYIIILFFFVFSYMGKLIEIPNRSLNLLNIAKLLTGRGVHSLLRGSPITGQIGRRKYWHVCQVSKESWLISDKKRSFFCYPNSPYGHCSLLDLLIKGYEGTFPDE